MKRSLMMLSSIVCITTPGEGTPHESRGLQWLYQAGTALLRYLYNPDALHNACRDGDVEKARRLAVLTHKINVRGSLLVMPLHLAVFNYHFEIIKILLKRGARPDVQDILGATPLHNAIFAQRASYTQYDNLKMLKMLLFYPYNIPRHWQPKSRKSDTLRSCKDLCIQYFAEKGISKKYLKKLPFDLIRSIADRRRLEYIKHLLLIENIHGNNVYDYACEYSYRRGYRDPDVLVCFIDRVLKAQTLNDLAILGYGCPLYTSGDVRVLP